MSKKITKLLGIIFAVVTLFSLAAPIYKTTFTDGESMVLLLRGFDLYEFSAWGILTILIPLLLIGIMFTKFSDKAKSAMVMGTFIFGNISVQPANTSMRDWIYAEATGTVHHFDGLVLYVACLLCASVFCYIHCIQKTTLPYIPSIHDFREYLDRENKTAGLPDVLEREYLLFNKPCRIIKNEKKVLCEEYDAHVLFATPDGYFITDAQDSHTNIEVEIEKNVSGFASKNTPAGLVGIFYEDVDLSLVEKARLMPACDISEGKAELICDGKKAVVRLSVDNGNITATVCDDVNDANELCGAVIVQNGKLAAVVTSYDAERNSFVCESAEKYTREMNKAFCEQEIFGIANGFGSFIRNSKK